MALKSYPLSPISDQIFLLHLTPLHIGHSALPLALSITKLNADLAGLLDVLKLLLIVSVFLQMLPLIKLFPFKMKLVVTTIAMDVKEEMLTLLGTLFNKMVL